MSSIIPNRSIIKISGVDSTKFLQNLVTNDVMSHKEGAIYAMMLSPQGRFLFDMFIVKRDNGYLLDIFTGTKDLLLKKLRMYKINLQVELEDCDGWCVGYMSSSSNKEDVIPAGAGIQFLYYLDPRFRSDDNTEHLGYRIILDSPIIDDASSSYFQDKYKYAIPDGGIDLIYDKAMPQEYGAEQLNAISYTKGCYVGQEVISRTKSQGVVRKKIYKISADFDLSNIPHGTEIVSNGDKIGIFCSGYKNEAIALIREENFLAVGSAVCLLDDKPVTLELAQWY